MYLFLILNVFYILLIKQEISKELYDMYTKIRCLSLRKSYTSNCLYSSILITPMWHIVKSCIEISHDLHFRSSITLGRLMQKLNIPSLITFLWAFLLYELWKSLILQLNKLLLHHAVIRELIWGDGSLRAQPLVWQLHVVAPKGEAVTHHCPPGRWLMPHLSQWRALDKKNITLHCTGDGSGDSSTRKNNIFHAVNNSDDSSHIHYTKGNKKKGRVTDYTELSLQQQVISDDYIRSEIATFFKKKRHFHKSYFASVVFGAS